MNNDYLDFTASQPAGRRTKIFAVTSRANGVMLGEVKWHGAWRKFAFFPASGCIFDQSCLVAIASQCRVSTYEHRESLKAVKQ